MSRCLIIFILLAFYTTLNAQEIKHASSHYRTSSGAIGPGGVIATETYNLKLNSPGTMILDSAHVSGYTIDGNSILIPISEDQSIEFKLKVYIHQKSRVFYKGGIIYQGNEVHVPASKLNNRNFSIDVTLFVRVKGKSLTLTRDKFDHSSSQFNK